LKKRVMPSKKKKKLYERLAGDDPSLAAVARLFIYQGDDLYKLEYLAFILNDVPPDSPAHSLAELIERLVTCAPAKQEWIRQENLTVAGIGPTPCTPAPGSPLYGLNQFLATNPCFLRTEGLERANGHIDICATHIPIPIGQLVGSEDKAMRERLEHLEPNRTVDSVAWLLWEVFYRNIDLTRLKKCSVCHRWFVDHSKNKSKTRCSARCTSQRWSWEARKQAGHRQRVGTGTGGGNSKRKVKGERYAKAKKA
jgi:hypothetical protein